MPIEIERKYLVADSSWRAAVDRSCLLRQAYFTTADKVSVRVRIIDEERAALTVKLPKSGLSRYEFEQDLSLREAHSLMELHDGHEIMKLRHEFTHGGHVWEIDDYKGDNEGLVIAEIELSREDEIFLRPPWLGKEVTGVARYQNSMLALRPYQSWPEHISLQETA